MSPPGDPGRSALLGEAEKAWHHGPRRWGKGFLITSKGAARWDRPAVEGRVDPANLVHPLARAGASLVIQRSLDASGVSECYTIANTTAEILQIGSVGISTPWRDVYPSAEECLKGAFHAHIWTGGANSWVWAAPMNGSGPGLGLDLMEGELWSYSVENRDHFASSNIRGHLYLHPTDHARNPQAFGGQPEIELEPGKSFSWRWRLAWFSDFEAFRATRAERDFSPVELSAQTGESIEIPATACAAPEPDSIRVRNNGHGRILVGGATPGIHWIEATSGARRSRAALLFHDPVDEIVRRRVNYILENQQALGGEPSRKGAFLCFDRLTGLTELPGAWGDWSDGRERLAMPVLVQEAMRRGWADIDRCGKAIGRFKNFARQFLLTPGLEVRGGSFEVSAKRLYNYPWMSEFFRNEYHRTGDPADLETAAGILEAYYANGGLEFLGFLHGIESLIDSLREAGNNASASRLRENAISQARRFRGMGDRLPNHEVNYEQSIVAPLALLLIRAQKLLPEEDWKPSIRQALAWLRAFEGEQPDARLSGIPIRHWDGFWFGRRRQWGDVFPHYWSVLSAAAYLEAAPILGEEAGALTARARRIFRANLVHFERDGFASCAFVYPSCVDGNPAHAPDPLANDQDWALVWMLRYEDRLPWIPGAGVRSAKISEGIKPRPAG